MAHRVQNVKMRNRAKFRGNRSNRCRDMAIFRFSKMAAVAVLDLQNFKVGGLKRVKLRRPAKFGRNQSNCSLDMAIFRFFKMAAAAILDF